MADTDSSIPLPSHIHYELLLQLLERETMSAVYQDPVLRAEVQELIVSLRKALSQQRQMETICRHRQISVDYRWSLNGHEDRSSA